MSDIIGLIPVGPASHAARPAPQAPRPAVPRLENSQSSGTATEHDRRRDPGSTAQPSLQARDPMPGPPPAFEASLLELESDLQSVIKRVAAAREKARDLQAIAPETPLTSPAEPARTEAGAAAPNPYD